MTASPLQQPEPTGSDNCLPIGTRIAEFEITGIIGEGGFGIVYLALDHSLQRTVALKEYMPPALATRSDDKQIAVRAKRHQDTFDAGLKSFINEARLLAQFDHPALIKVYRFWEQNNTAYIAMRYYQGKTLKEILAEQPSIATEAWWKAILKPILEALDTLYAVNILHRDISPENIMIQPDGKPVLLDFGAARQLLQDITQSLTVILKPGYAPIEQYADDPSMKQGPWTDIYALSAVVYANITRQAPPASVARLLKDPLQPLTRDAYPDYSSQFLLAISKGLAVRPEDRPQTIKEFSRMLVLDRRSSSASHAKATAAAKAAPARDGNAPTSGRSVAAAAAAPAASSGGSRRRTVGMAATVAGVACLAAIGMLAFKGKPESAPAAVTTTPTVATAPTAVRSDTPIPPAASERSLPAENKERAPSPAVAAQAPSPQAPVSRQTAASQSAPAAAAPSRPAKVAAAQTGTVQLYVKPWGNIVVDGVAKGVSPPLKRMTLSPGKHQIRVSNPQFADHVVEINVTSAKPVRIDHDFSRSKK